MTAIHEATMLESERAAAFRALADRAERARTQAQAQCQTLERALFRTRDLGPSVDCRPRMAQRAASHGPATARPATGGPGAGGPGAGGPGAARIAELEEIVDGLLKRLESQGPIEQAKGIIMSQTRCDPDQAFEILRRASQRSNTKLRLLALDLVARTCKAEAPGAKLAHG